MVTIISFFKKKKCIDLSLFLCTKIFFVFFDIYAWHLSCTVDLTKNKAVFESNSEINFLSHKITKSKNVLGWKRHQRSSSSSPHGMDCVSNHLIRLHRAACNLALNAFKSGSSTAFLVNIFQCLTTHWEKISS